MSSVMKTVRYIQYHIRDGQCSMSALGFYVYLLSKPKQERKLRKADIMEELRITEKTLYSYIRELRSIHVLDIEVKSPQPTEYRPLILTGEALENFHRWKTNIGTPLREREYVSSLGTLSTDTVGEDHLKNSRGPETKLLRVINDRLPGPQKWRGMIPKRHAKNLIRLSERVDLSRYVDWFVREKIEGMGKTFGWGLFLYPSMIVEFESGGGRARDSLQTTTKWVDHAADVQKRAAALASKIKRLSEVD